MTTPPADYDSPWKEVLDIYLEPFLGFCFPVIHAEIDWAREPVPRDKELQQIVREAELGRCVVDKLVQVWRRDGMDTWVLIHIEVQSQEERDFARRMFTYYYRLLDRYDQPVVSLAVLGDDRPGWRPKRYRTALWDCSVVSQYPAVKPLDYRKRWAALEVSRNPFATVVMAHLTALATRQAPVRRIEAKLALTRRLYELGYNEREIVNLFRFIDWLLALPPELEARFLETLEQDEEARHMPYITSVERSSFR